METSQLRSMVALAGTRNFRKAAAQRFISQPSLSQHIRQLESELGVRLVDRGQRPVALTGAGTLFAARAEEILRRLDELVAEVRDVEGNADGSIEIGAMQYLALVELPEMLADFRRRHPRTRLHLRVGNTGEVRAMLLDREIQVGLLHLETDPLPATIHTEVLRADELVVILAGDDPRLAAGHVEWGELADTPFVTFREGASLRLALEEAAARAGFAPEIQVESADISAAIALVAKGLGAALVPSTLAARVVDRVGHVTVGDRSLVRTLVVASDAARYESRAVRDFIVAARRDFR
jgi:DNA-binding transcriptional LysR family regulator